MNKDFYISLISKRLSSELNAAELKALNSWLNEGKDNANLLQEFRNIWEATGQYKQQYSFNADTAFDAFNQKYKTDNSTDTQTPSEVTRPTVTLNKYIWIAVAAIGLILSLFLFNNLANRDIIENTNMSAMSVDLNPSAQVTLAPDSRLRNLTDKNVAENEPGSRIALSAISDLEEDRYNGNILAGDLEGRAYFNLKNKYSSIPYTIQLEDDILIGVHEAEFNIQNYMYDTHITIDVASGDVLFDAGEKTKLLTKGQRLLYNKSNGDITLSTIPALSPFDWHEGILAFDNTPLREVFTTIEKFYGVEIEVVDNSPVEGHFTAFNLKPGSLNELLELLQASIDMKIVRKGLDKIEISEINAE